MSGRRSSYFASGSNKAQRTQFPSLGSGFISIEAFKLRILLVAHDKGIAVRLIESPTSTTRATFRCTTAATPSSLACPCHAQASRNRDGRIVVTSVSRGHSRGCLNGQFGTMEKNRAAMKETIAGLRNVVKEQEKRAKEEGAAVKEGAGAAKKGKAKAATQEYSDEDRSSDEGSSSDDEGQESAEDEQVVAFKALKAAEEGPFPPKHRLKEEIAEKIENGDVYPPSPLSAFRTSRDLAIAVWAWVEANNLELRRVSTISLSKAVFKLVCREGTDSKPCPFLLEAEQDNDGLWRFAWLKLAHNHPLPSIGASNPSPSQPLSSTTSSRRKRSASTSPIPPPSQRQRLETSPTDASTCTSLFAPLRPRSAAAPLPSGPSTSDVESFTTLLPAFLAGVFPRLADAERSALASSILDSGIASIDDLATLLLLANVAVGVLFKAVEGSKGETEEMAVGAFRRGVELMREAYEKGA
ncbi:hypothetical protein JCM6882_006942 [Rhodosporidiobolus microsporus]